MCVCVSVSLNKWIHQNVSNQCGYSLKGISPVLLCFY